ncbi:ATP-dependent endonuclease [Actinomadura syzygii]|uniref:ATP-dependent nuclease n=1 Tax=Actinomadura syzygii TaxID=1427538 RepID=UPI001CA31A29|nr:AAA family ATPase [Actinomadura syzygii]
MPIAYLSTDRLTGWMSRFPQLGEKNPAPIKGSPLTPGEQSKALEDARNYGLATDALIAMRNMPDVRIKVASVLGAAFGRRFDLVDISGFLDVQITKDKVRYSLIRDESHGLKELIVFLSKLYRHDWRVIVVDEPELHLHPSLTRLLITELQRECEVSGRNGIVVTHEPRALAPRSFDDLDAIIVFSGEKPKRLGEGLDTRLHHNHARRIAESLGQYPTLVSELVFSPRPVLVEGPDDVIALKEAVAKNMPATVVAQTDFIPCGSSSLIPIWLDMATLVGLDARAVSDLDSIFDPSMQATVDRRSGVQEDLRNSFLADPAKTSEVLQPIRHEAKKRKLESKPDVRARWLAGLEVSCDDDRVYALRRDALLDVWRSAGVWLHKDGRLEDALGLGTEIHNVRAKALIKRVKEHSGLDAVAKWASYQLDVSVSEFETLCVEVERIAQNLLREHRVNPGVWATAPVGPTSETDSKLVQVEAIEGRYKITVLKPLKWVGYWMHVGRETPLNEWVLKPPPQV